jgi:predicted transcriptional regulator
MKVILSKHIFMTTVSFKADDDLKKNLDLIAQKKGINTSAYIKLVLTKEIKGELAEVTENGLTVAEEMNILDSAANDKVFGPFSTTKELIEAMKKTK